MKGEIRILEKLILNRLGGLTATELELACCNDRGESAQVSDVFRLAGELEKLLYRVGELKMGITYRRRGQARQSIRERLCIVVQRPRSDRVFSLRISLGGIERLPFKEDDQFRQDVIENFITILTGYGECNGSENSVLYVDGIAKLYHKIVRMAGAFGEAIILDGVQGRVVRLK